MTQHTSEISRHPPTTWLLTFKIRVEKYIFKYEPLYVARAETPQFDERFIGFGMTRNTQVNLSNSDVNIRSEIKSSL